MVGSGAAEGKSADLASLFRPTLAAVEHAGGVGQGLGGELLDDGAGDVLLAGEVMIKGGAGDAGAGGDVGHAGALEPEAQEGGAGCVQDAGSAVLRVFGGGGHGGFTRNEGWMPRVAAGSWIDGGWRHFPHRPSAIRATLAAISNGGGGRGQ